MLFFNIYFWLSHIFPWWGKYFNAFSREERTKVKYFVSDMWKPYSNIFSVWFKNATHIVDKYHWIRQVIWAFEAARKQEQKRFRKSHRRYFKKSRQLLIKRFKFLSDEQKQQVNIMLYASPTELPQIEQTVQKQPNW